LNFLSKALTHTIHGVRPTGKLRFPHFAPSEMVAGKNLPVADFGSFAARRVQYREVLHPKDMLNVFFSFRLTQLSYAPVFKAA